MIMRFCPPFIFAHRVYLARGENELSAKRIAEKFGQGGRYPQLADRWNRGTTAPTELVDMGLDKFASGAYYGFRTADDQMLFYMTFEGQLKGK